jgi:hypothetical protein
MELRALLIGLLCLMLPWWLLAGFGDWLCHRRTRIERTAGPRESALHVVLYLLIAAPLVPALFLQINALLLAFMTAGVLAHMAVSLWDTSYAQPRRHISPLEQQIHSHLEMLPTFALALVVVLHWEAVLNPTWTLTAREQPLPWTGGIWMALALGFLFIVEELLRCLRATRRIDEAPGHA